MSDQQMQHFDRAADHFRQAILVVQDVIYGMMGVTGALLVAFNSFELNAHPQEAGTLLAAGALLIAVAGIRWAFRRSPCSPRQSS
jgi:hypothetical protein